MKYISIALAIIVLVAGGVAACAAFDSGDFVKSKVPAEVQESQGLPPKVSHNTNIQAFERWQRNQQAVQAIWVDEIEKSQKWVGFIDGFTYQAWESFSPFLASAGPLGSVALALGGWLFLPRPGDKSPAEVQKEKEGSFNEGDQRNRALMIRLAESNAAADRRGRELAGDIAKAKDADTSEAWSALFTKWVTPATSSKA